jgi:hypothetical protein
MRALPIVWQRLVDSQRRTCDRCQATFEALQEAVEDLKPALQPLGIEPTLETREVDEEAFKGDPSQSNRVWIAGKPIEDWLGVRVGKSPCPCLVCADCECRTLETETEVFESIPKEVFLRAALLAASELVSPLSAAS